MIRPNSGGDCELEVARGGQALPGEVRRPERLRDDHVDVSELGFENRIGALLAVGYRNLVALSTKPVHHPETEPSS